MRTCKIHTCQTGYILVYNMYDLWNFYVVVCAYESMLLKVWVMPGPIVHTFGLPPPTTSYDTYISILSPKRKRPFKCRTFPFQWPLFWLQTRFAYIYIEMSRCFFQFKIYIVLCIMNHFTIPMIGIIRIENTIFLAFFSLFNDLSQNMIC